MVNITKCECVYVWRGGGISVPSVVEFQANTKEDIKPHDLKGGTLYLVFPVIVIVISAMFIL